jgi:Zn-finger nucleic acid-binding protein
MRLEADKRCLVCDYCTSIFLLEESADGVRATGETSPVFCPVCRVALEEAYVDQFQALHCPKCRGLLFRQVLFLPIIEYLRLKNPGLPVTPPPFNPRELERKLFCPHCGQKLDTHPYGGPGNLVIDNCPRCLVNWLDHNELSRIVRSSDRRIWNQDGRMHEHLRKLFSQEQAGGE